MRNNAQDAFERPAHGFAAACRPENLSKTVFAAASMFIFAEEALGLDMSQKYSKNRFMGNLPKKKIHLSWDEVLKAEAERERARKASCRPVPDSIPLKRLLVKYLSLGIAKLKPKSWHLPDWLSPKGHTGSG
jgi:hypothetical protein